MEKTKYVERLNDLIKLDFDAVNSYEEAIQEISIESVRSQLRTFQNDHRQHIQRLSAAVQAQGGKPHDRGSAKGFFLKQMTAIRARMGNESAIRAMQANETLVNNHYAKAAKEPWPDDLRKLVESNYRDEQRHLSYLQECITRRVWDEGHAQHP